MSILSKDNTKTNLSKKLDKILDKKECKGEDCLINDPEELVKKEHKRIITNDGRELLSEYTTR